MSVRTYLKKINQTLSSISAKTGRSVPSLWISYGMCYLRMRGQVMIHEFYLNRLYEASGWRQKQFLTWRRSIILGGALCREATREDIDVFGHKDLFNTAFKEFVHRDWLYIPDSTEADIRAFLARNDKFLMKENGLTQGFGITVHYSKDIDPDAFVAEYMGKPNLLEAFIRQHPAISAINPSSVNTVRIVTARKPGTDKVVLVGACLRCGGGGAHVDNFHQGGVAYPLNLEEGFVTGPGKNEDGDLFFRHPSTGYLVPGFQVPHWDTVVQAVRRAAMIPPRVGYVGWDVAVTADGIEFIEGNVNYPDSSIIQADGPGPYQRLKDVVTSAG